MLEALVLFCAAFQAEQAPSCPVPEVSLRPGALEIGGEFVVLGQMEREVVQIYRRLRPSLVQIQLPVSPKPGDGNLNYLECPESGLVVSGVVLQETKLGCLVVIPGLWSTEREGVKVVDLDGQVFSGVPIAQARDYGLTLLQVDGLCVEVPLFGLCETMPLGSVTIALGNPYGLDGTISMGMLSGRGRNLAKAADLIQITNPLNPGDGGGIVADSKGRLVAISMSSLSEIARVQGWGGEEDERGSEMIRARGISFAVPLHRVLQVFEEHLSLPSEAPRLRLGLEVQVAVIPREIRRDLGLLMRTGLRVLKVEPNTPAMVARIEVGDFILGLGGQSTQDFADLFRALRLVRSTSSLEILRGGQIVDLQLEFPGPGVAQDHSGTRPRVVLSPPALQPSSKPGEGNTKDRD